MVKGTKIAITDDPEGLDSIKVKENERSSQHDQEFKKSEQQIEKFYSDEAIQPPSVKTGRIIWLTIILSIVFGSIASLAGSIIILTSDKIQIPFGQAIDIKKYLPTREIDLTTEKNITVTQDSRIDELFKEMAPELINLFAANSSSGTNSDKFYTPQEALGNGFALTNDGWLVFNKKLFVSSQKKYVAIAGQTISPIDKIIFDQMTGAVFVKSSLPGLTPLKIAKQEDLTPGQEVIIFAPDGSVVVNQISLLNYRPYQQSSDLIRSTDQFDDYILLASPVDPQFIGSPVIGLDKSVIGLAAGNNLVGPCYQFNNIISSVLANKSITRPYVGLNYLNLSDVATLDPALKIFNQGALVWGKPAPGSPAAQAGLLDQDLITKADGLPLNQIYNLRDIIQGHHPNDTIEITVARQGVEKTIKLILGAK
ncbi:MAG: S1C family serine protease [Candidatus Parcubacteria bacterium]|nr:S1C family serine protease [Candidatus Parcubacteria bacterium]